MRTTLDANSFPSFKKSGAQAKRLQSATPAMSHQFQHSHSRAQARRSKVKR
jgi:hypothetical protein